MESKRRSCWGDWYSLVVLAALASLAMAKPGAAAEPERLVFFGDSLSDSGNHFVAFGTSAIQPFQPVPDDSYAIGGHHFSNGATWAEDIAADLGTPTSGSPSLREPGLFTNYAVGRARARSGADVFSDFDLSTQVGLFLTDFNGKAPPEFVYVVWIGSNDLTDAVRALAIDSSGGLSQAILTQAVGAVVQNLQTLWGAGARRFLVPSLPDPALTPYVRSFGPAGEYGAHLLAAMYNAGLETVLAKLETGLPGTEFLRLDMNAVFGEVMAGAQIAGLNTEDPCLTFEVEGKAICAKPQQYLFWDGIHPTKTAHRFIADAALEVLASP